jgi:non-specific serine/threonine protein kinase
LAASGEEESVRRAHAGYAIALGERIDLDAAGGVFRPWFATLAAEQGNLRAALAWLEASGQVDQTLQLAGALWPLWYVLGPYHEERELLERVLAKGSTARFDVRGRAAWGAGILAVTQGDLERAVDHFSAATDEARSLGFTLGHSGGLLGLAWVALGRGEFERAAEYQRASLTLARELDGRGEARGFVAMVLSELGSSLFALGRLDEAATAFEEAIERRRVTNQSWGFATALIGLGFVASARGDQRQAHPPLIEGLTHADENGDLRLAALALTGVASVAVAWGKPRIAARLLGAAERPGTSGFPIEPAYRQAKEQTIAACRTMLGDEAMVAIMAEGGSLDLDMVIAEAGKLTPAPGVQDADSSGAVRLSPRELDVLRLIVEGQTDREIGETLFISHRTVMTHVSNILAKLGVESRTVAAARAVRDNLV